MMFCPKCGALLRPQPGAKGMGCSCGYTDKNATPISIKESVKSKSEDVEVVDADEKTLPIADVECPKCKHDKAYYWLVQTRAGDEPETKFLKCVKCTHTWRDYS
ncbi:MAG: transcription factor S [Nanoarchaeota archaeon]